MTSRDFAYWLQGYFEIVGASDEAVCPLTAKQVDCIRKHLAMVFLHEIDPSMGTPAHQAKLDEAHGKPTGGGNPFGPVFRC